MNQQDQIKALAELDGEDAVAFPSYTKPYLTSYDAILPLVQNQPHHIIACIYDDMRDEGWTDGVVRLLNFTPSQLCEALLRATGKWKDNE